MNNLKWFWNVPLIVSLVLVAGVYAQSQYAAAAVDDAKLEGRIVEIAPAKAEKVEIQEQPAESEQPTYWIGIRGRNVTEPVLRTQFQLAQDMGVVIEEVVKDSPAAKAGLRQHDILLRANGEPVLSMEELAKLVSEGGAEPIELRIIRLGKEETIVVVPEERPAGLEDSSGLGDLGRGFGGAFPADPDGAGPFGAFRMFPGAFVFPPQGGMMAFNNQMPNGYAVTVTRKNDEPMTITVKKGDQTWTIVGDDKEELKQLPEDVREYVQGLLAGSVKMGFEGELNDLQQNLQERMKEFQQRLPEGNFRLPEGLPFNEGQDPVLQRMEQLERQLKELQQRLDESDNQ